MLSARVQRSEPFYVQKMWIWAYECGCSLYHTVLFVVLSCMYPLVFICREINLAPLLTLHISDMPFRLSHWKLTQTAHCFMLFSPSPLFHFAMECLMWGVKKSCRVKHCNRAALWYAPSPNLILAVLKIVCVPSRTDRPLFPESLCCPRRWKRPLCTSSTAQRPHEIFTGQHLVWDRERGARESTTLPPITARPQLY